jgi:hypothetical protein
LYVAPAVAVAANKVLDAATTNAIAISFVVIDAVTVVVAVIVVGAVSIVFAIAASDSATLSTASFSAAAFS